MKTEKCPVVVIEDGKIIIKEMHFSFCPPWSPEFPCKWSTYNARLDRPKIDKKTQKTTTELIYQVPTWRDAFSKGQVCLVPMNSAIESCYFGTHAGNIVRFSTKKDSLFLALGIWSEWVDIKTGEVKETFAILTDHPNKFFFKTGHDRSLINIDTKKQEYWLKEKNLSAKERLDFIRSHRVNLDWKVDIERPLKKGWEKRAPTQDEIKQVSIWN